MSVYDLPLPRRKVSRREFPQRTLPKSHPSAPLTPRERVPALCELITHTTRDRQAAAVRSLALRSTAARDQSAEALRNAIALGDESTALHLLESGADPNGVTSTTSISSTTPPSTPLHIACFHGSAAIATALIQHGATVDGRSPPPLGPTPLYVAAARGCVKVVQALLTAGADVGCECTRSHETALHTAVKSCCVLSESSLLHARAESTRLKVIDVIISSAETRPLVAERSRIRESNSSSISSGQRIQHLPVLAASTLDRRSNQLRRSVALDRSYSRQRSTTATRSRDRRWINSQTRRGETALFMAAASGIAPIGRRLLQAGADASLSQRGGVTPMIAAARAGHVDFIEALLEAGADPNLADRAGCAPVLAAAERGHAAVVTLLLAHGAAPDHAAGDGSTALHAAAWIGSLDTMSALIDGGAALNLRRSDGGSALHNAAFRNQPAAVRALVAAGADRTIKASYNSETPLHLARRLGSKEALAVLVHADSAEVSAFHTARAHAQHTAHTDACTASYVVIAASVKAAYAAAALAAIAASDAKLAEKKGKMMMMMKKKKKKKKKLVVELIRRGVRRGGDDAGAGADDEADRRRRRQLSWGVRSR